MRNDIFKYGDKLTNTLDNIVNTKLNKIIDEMIEIVKEWQKSSDVISCQTIIFMLEARKNKINSDQSLTEFYTKYMGKFINEEKNESFKKNI